MPQGDFVIGVAIRDDSAVFHFVSVLKARVVNDQVDDLPVAVFVNPDTLKIDVYLRSPSGPPGIREDLPRVLTFRVAADGTVTDEETASRWDVRTGLAVEGPYRRAALRHLPYITSFDWAWRDFYPESRFWGEAP